jgi:hypothetical protein
MKLNVRSLALRNREATLAKLVAEVQMLRKLVCLEECKLRVRQRQSATSWRRHE